MYDSKAGLVSQDPSSVAVTYDPDPTSRADVCVGAGGRRRRGKGWGVRVEGRRDGDGRAGLVSQDLPLITVTYDPDPTSRADTFGPGGVPGLQGVCVCLYVYVCVGAGGGGRVEGKGDGVGRAGLVSQNSPLIIVTYDPDPHPVQTLLDLGASPDFTVCVSWGG